MFDGFKERLRLIGLSGVDSYSQSIPFNGWYPFRGLAYSISFHHQGFSRQPFTVDQRLGLPGDCEGNWLKHIIIVFG